MNMQSKWLVASLLTILPLASAHAVMVPPVLALADLPPGIPGESTAFTVTDDTQVPGKTLAAGTYTIRVVDHLSDRMIVRVERNGKSLATFLALPKSSLAKSAHGPITLSGGKKPAMRGFVFPDGTVAEFVYLKGDAVGLAKNPTTTIPAIDPSSEGKPDTSKLSKEDMQMVTLWMLTPTPVGPDTAAGIAAARYQVPAAESSTEATSQVARASTPPRPRVHPRPVMAALPHTAGEMPMVLLTGVFSLGAAGWMRRRRNAA